MNSREHLNDDLDRLVNRSRWVGYFAWAVAIIVMIYGTPIVYGFLTDHAVPGKVAWLLSLAADAALIVGLIATPVLAELDEPAGWVGTLRWVAGFITWGLQTAGSWTAPAGPDIVGVLSHTAGPVLLFFAVEAASSFQRKVSAKLTEKTRQLEAAEQRDADDRAHRAEVDARLRSTTAELTAARSEITALTERLTAAVKTIERREGEIGDLRHALVSQKEASDADKAEAMRALREKHTEALRRRAEAETISLDAHRKNHNKSGQASPTRTASVKPTDEDHLQTIREAHPDWASKTVSLGQIKTAIGISGQATAIRLRDALYPDGRPGQKAIAADDLYRSAQ